MFDVRFLAFFKDLLKKFFKVEMINFVVVMGLLIMIICVMVGVGMLYIFMLFIYVIW